MSETEHKNIKVNFIEGRVERMKNEPKEFLWEALMFIGDFIVPDNKDTILSKEDKLGMLVKFLNENECNLDVPFKYLFDKEQLK